jgi:hypothetical protein
MAELIKGKRKVRKPLSSGEREKEREVRHLIDQVQKLGLVVRREELKRGIGWKASSGTCVVTNERVVFVDRRLPLTEQLVFLSSLLVKASKGKDTSLQEYSAESSQEFGLPALYDPA